VALVGDYNGDGVVDAADYTVWRNTLNSTTDLRADGDQSGAVDSNDYAVWKNHYGAGALAGTSLASVPEPGILPLLAIGLALAIPTLRSKRLFGSSTIRRC
jgi:hypothetical protein